MTAPAAGIFGDYLLDAWHRSVLFLDVLRERGNTFRAQQAKAVPHVLQFAAELVLDGRDAAASGQLCAGADRPARRNRDRSRQAAVRGGRSARRARARYRRDEARQRDRHGARRWSPRATSSASPAPLPGQTVEDVWNAEAAFIAEAARLHPDLPGKPVVIANCQAGWQTMIMAATRPELAGPILLAGSPLSYWAGAEGQNPMRYTAGLLGGPGRPRLPVTSARARSTGPTSSPTSRSLNPANTLWDKPHNVYAHVDTERERFLAFETWWGSPVLLNAGEMQWIADNLFVGNKLAAGKLRTREGLRIDLRNVQSPIVVFASWGDDITPPQQALGWITDLYADDADLELQGQTIVYSLHPSVGHLGIFVSGKVASEGARRVRRARWPCSICCRPGSTRRRSSKIDAGTSHPELIGGAALCSGSRRVASPTSARSARTAARKT